MRLSDTQLIILSRASQNPEGHAFPFGRHQVDPAPEVKRLLQEGLLKRTKVDDPRKPIFEKGYTLTITNKGLKQINVY